MDEQLRSFDDDQLFKLKEQHCGYRICPRCGTTLVERELDGRRRPACPDPHCHFVFYQNPVPAAGAIIVEDNRVLMVKRAHPPRVGWWCLPAGFMEWHEHPTQTAVREIREETGLDIELTSFFEVYSGTDDPRVNAVLMLYLAKRIGGRLEANDDALEVRFFGFDELPDEIAFASHRQALADYRRRLGI
jgi:8-oxo-dGTP diphosphatase